MSTLEIIEELERSRLMLIEAEDAECESDIHAIWSYIEYLREELAG